jgi:hypothetical protein
LHFSLVCAQKGTSQSYVFSIAYLRLKCCLVSAASILTLLQISGNQGGSTTSATGNSQMQEWVQGAIAKISNNSDGAATATQNPMSTRSSFMPISINTGTFPGTPAVRLIGDCHFLHRLCQLLLFCLLFRRRQSPRLLANSQKNQDSAIQKIQHMMNAKTEDNSTTVRSGLGAAKVEDGQSTRGGQFVLGAKGPEENPIGKSVRIGSGNAGQGYTSDEVIIKFLAKYSIFCRNLGFVQLK